MNTDSRLLLTLRQAADELQLGETMTKRLVATGALLSVKIGRSRRVPRNALQAFVEKLQAEQEQEH